MDRSVREAPPRLSAGSKFRLALRTWSYFLGTVIETRRHALPDVVAELETLTDGSKLHVDPRRLGRIVAQVLRIGPWRARCLYTSLVLFRLLREQGDRPVLVIGLPKNATGTRAHAWLELDGLEVGPPPGARGHLALGRFGGGRRTDPAP